MGGSPSDPGRAAHTPGPWHRNIKPASKYPVVWAGRNTHVAMVVRGAPPRSGSGETMPDAEMEANIDLIAAAPEMYEALKLAQSAMEHMGNVLNGMDAVTAEDVALATPAFEAVDSAIVKAEGR